MSSKEIQKNILSLLYMRILRLFLLPIGCWPGEMFGEKLSLLTKSLKYFFPVVVFIETLGVLYYAVYYYGKISFLLFGDVSLTFSLSVLTLIRISLPLFKRYDTLMADYVKKYHLMHFKHKQGFYNKTFKSMEMVSDYYTKLVLASMICGMSLFNIVPLYNSYKKIVYMKTTNESVLMDFSVLWKFPGYDQQDRPFLLTTILNLTMTYQCSVTLVFIDLLMFLMVFQMIGHLKILEFNLKDLSRIGSNTDTQLVVLDSPSNEAGKEKEDMKMVAKLFDDDVDKNINRTLKESVRQHTLLINFAADISSFFGPLLAVNYFFHLFACCLLLLVCSVGGRDALARFGTLALIVFGQLVQVSVIFEFVSTASENLSSAVYSVPWELMGSDNRRLISIMLMRMQTPIEVTAMGITKVGVQTMASILKTTFSYYMFLKSKSE